MEEDVAFEVYLGENRKWGRQALLHFYKKSRRRYNVKMIDIKDYPFKATLSKKDVDKIDAEAEKKEPKKVDPTVHPWDARSWIE